MNTASRMGQFLLRRMMMAKELARATVTVQEMKDGSFDIEIDGDGPIESGTTVATLIANVGFVNMCAFSNELMRKKILPVFPSQDENQDD
jgi:hypothetical protein